MIQYTSITYIFFHFFSRCVILISSILPRGNSTLSHKTSPSLLQNLNNKAKYVNACLQTITNSNRSIHFIDNSDFFLQDGRVNRQLLSRDGLHLSFSGTSTLIRSISGTSTLIRSIVAHVNRLLPNVKNCPVIVTDRESALNNAIKSYLPNAKIVHCWNHIRRDIKQWLRTHDGKTDDMSVYPANIVALLQIEDLNAIETLYNTVALKWSKPSDEYSM